MLHIISVTFQQPTELLVSVSSFVLQTNPNWELNVVHDGPIPEDVMKIMSIFKDPRIRLTYSETRTQCWGHKNRRKALEELEGEPTDYVLFTNGDNYVVPQFVEQMMAATDYMRINSEGALEPAKAGIVYCNCVHSHLKYALHKSELYEGGVDMAALIVRFDIAKEVGFVHFHFSADGAYATECKAKCDELGLECRHIHKPLFCHN